MSKANETYIKYERNTQNYSFIKYENLSYIYKNINS